MTITLSEKSVLILAANGFDENNLAVMQRALTKIKVPHKIAAPEQGLVNGWQGNGWGHYFTVDSPIGTVLGSDYDALVLVGGERGVAKLKDNAHTKRIVNHFLEAGKAVSVIGMGALLLTLSAKSAGRSVSAPASIEADLKAAQMDCLADTQTLDGVILSSDGTDVDAWVEASLKLFEEADPFREEEQAAA